MGVAAATVPTLPQPCPVCREIVGCLERVYSEWVAVWKCPIALCASTCQVVLVDASRLRNVHIHQSSLPSRARVIFILPPDARSHGHIYLIIARYWSGATAGAGDRAVGSGHSCLVQCVATTSHPFTSTCADLWGRNDTLRPKRRDDITIFVCCGSLGWWL